jgi:hypothetical protein
MRTKLQTLVTNENAVVDRNFDRILSDKGYKLVTTLSGEQALNAGNDAEIKVPANRLAKTGLFAKNVALFLVSPFIALGYVVALPFVGFYMFGKLMLEAQQKRQLNL